MLCQDKLPEIAIAAGKASTFNIRYTADQSVGGGLLPIAVDQSAYPQLTHCHREQAPSHIFYRSVSGQGGLGWGDDTGLAPT